MDEFGIDRLKANIAATKETLDMKCKAEPYGPLYAAGVAHYHTVIAECMAIVNTACANMSSPSLSVHPRHQEIMEPLLQRQVWLFRFWFLGYFINATEYDRNFWRWYHPSYRISRLLREARSVSLQASVVQLLVSPSSGPHEPAHNSSSESSDLQQAKSRTATQASSNKAAFFRVLFQIQITILTSTCFLTTRKATILWVSLPP